MKTVFSFSLFGSADKYCKGLLRNIEEIRERFPGWLVYVAIGNDVPEHMLETLRSIPIVHLTFTGETGLVNMSYRFFAIDDPTVDISIVRDADSRIYERDAECIKDFVNSPNKFHIIRDHPNHFHRIMGGMWGIKKGILSQPLFSLFQEWRKTHSATEFWNDMEFLAAVFYPYVLNTTMVHDTLHTFEPEYMKTPFRVPIGDGSHFIGQSYLFDDNGNEYPHFNYFKTT